MAQQSQSSDQWQQGDQVSGDRPQDQGTISDVDPQNDRVIVNTTDGGEIHSSQTTLESLGWNKTS